MIRWDSAADGRRRARIKLGRHSRASQNTNRINLSCRILHQAGEENSASQRHSGPGLRPSALLPYHAVVTNPHVQCEPMKDINGSSPPASKLARAKTTPYATSSKQYEAQLSERDSIFATSYANDEDSPSPVAASATESPQSASVSVASASASAANALPRQSRLLREAGATGRIDIPTRPHSRESEGEMAVTPARSLDNLALQFGPYLNSLPHDRPALFDKTSIKSLSNRSDLAAQHYQYTHRTPVARHMRTHSRTGSNSSRASSRSSRPSTPLNLVSSRHFDDLQSSAERQSYRSWRQGKAKMQGMTIAESQRLQKETEDVDRKIDAKMPKAEPGQNVRSRKTSHYLGLFKENEQEVKKAEDKIKDKHHELATVSEGRDDSVVGTFPSISLSCRSLELPLTWPQQKIEKRSSHQRSHLSRRVSPAISSAIGLRQLKKKSPLHTLFLISRSLKVTILNLTMARFVDSHPTVRNRSRRVCLRRFAITTSSRTNPPSSRSVKARQLSHKS